MSAHWLGRLVNGVQSWIAEWKESRRLIEFPELAYEMDHEGIRRRLAGGGHESVRWQDLRAVAIQTTGDGPFGEDFFWVLIGEAGTGCVVGNEVACRLNLLPRLQALEGFDNGAVIRASGSVEDAWFPCWERNSIEEEAA